MRRAAEGGLNVHLRISISKIIENNHREYESDMARQWIVLTPCRRNTVELDPWRLRGVIRS